MGTPRCRAGCCWTTRSLRTRTGSRRILLAGKAIRYAPEAAVRHSHPYTIFTAFRRFFESGVAGRRPFLAGRRAAQGALRRKGADYARDELRWLVQTGNARWIPYACL